MERAKDGCEVDKGWGQCCVLAMQQGTWGARFLSWLGLPK